MVEERTALLLGQLPGEPAPFGSWKKGFGALLSVQEKLAQWGTCCAGTEVLKKYLFSQKMREEAEFSGGKNVSLHEET